MLAIAQSLASAPRAGKPLTQAETQRLRDRGNAPVAARRLHSKYLIDVVGLGSYDRLRWTGGIAGQGAA